jgi:hypothetical protein
MRRCGGKWEFVRCAHVPWGVHNTPLSSHVVNFALTRYQHVLMMPFHSECGMYGMLSFPCITL